MSKQNINNVLKLYNANYYSEPVLDENLLKFHNALEDYIEKIKFANNNNENEEHIKNQLEQKKKNEGQLQAKLEEKKKIESQLQAQIETKKKQFATQLDVLQKEKKA